MLDNVSYILYDVNMKDKDKPQITILWGTDKEEKKTYVFENEEQKSFFMKGVDEANGWLEYEEEEKWLNII